MSHQMPEPTGIASLDDLLRQEIVATKQHYRGVTDQAHAIDTVGLAADYVSQVPHAPQSMPSRAQRDEYRKAVLRYHAAAAAMLDALDVMKGIASRGRVEFDTAQAMAKQVQTQHLRIGRRSI